MLDELMRPQVPYFDRLVVAARHYAVPIDIEAYFIHVTVQEREIFSELNDAGWF